MRRSTVFLGLLFFLLPIPALAGSLAISVTSVEHGTIPRGAQRVPVLEVKLQSISSASIQVFGIDVKREGQGSSVDIERVYLMEGVRRISRGVSLSREGIATLRPRRFTLAPGEVRSLTVAADYSASSAAGGIHRFRIEVIETSEGIERVEASFTESPGATVAPENRGNLTVTFLTVPGMAHALSLSTLARLRIDADREYDHILKSITLRNEGTARGLDLRDLALYLRGRRVTEEVPSLSGKEVTLIFSEDVSIASGKNLIFELKGRPWTRVRTAQFTLEEESDLVAEATQNRR